MPAAGRAAEQVTHHGGHGPTVSPDGKFLYYLKDSGGLWRVPLEGGDEMQMVPHMHRYSYAVPERGIYFAVPLSSGRGGTIEFLDPATRMRSVLARTDKGLDLGVSV